LSHWTNKVVMITGASSGIGRGLAHVLSQRGAKLGLVARRATILDEIVDEVQGHNGRAIPVAADVRDAEAMRLAAERVSSEIGPIDVLIANAGIGTTTHAVNLVPAKVAEVVNTNVLGVVNTVAAVTPAMVARGSGQLVAISSLSAYRGLPKSAAYCASKAGLSSFMESIRLDLAGTGVTVTIIHPGFIKTPLTADREARMPFLMELDDAVDKIVTAIERNKKSYAFPWQLASIVRLGMVMPNFMYDWVVGRTSFRE
jgi:short-subunit dehydrogenase